ncbi:MAG: Fic family protein [Nanoarchaeota archaeon]
MVIVRQRQVKGRIYYYLEHTFRIKSKVVKKELYLGKVLPKNVEELKKRFLHELYKEKWYGVFDKVKEQYAKELKNTPPSALLEEQKKFSIRFTYDTQRIEGSKLTLRETTDLLEKGISPRAKPMSDAKEAQAHQKVWEEMFKTQKELSLQPILYWHKQLFKDSKPDIGGKIRQHRVGISGSKFAPPLPVELYPLLDDFFRWYAKNKGVLHSVELAALVHLRFVTIHPFADGNGRLSRLLMNLVLCRKGYPPLNIQYEGRSSYYHALERSQIKNNDAIFVQWFFKRYAKECQSFTKRN